MQLNVCILHKYIVIKIKEDTYGHMIKASFIFCNIKLFSSQWIIFNRKIKIENTSGIVGDEYKKVYVPVRKGNMNFEKYGLKVRENGYYYYLRNYCLHIRYHLIIWYNLFKIFIHILAKSITLLAYKGYIYILYPKCYLFLWHLENIMTGTENSTK